MSSSLPGPLDALVRQSELLRTLPDGELDTLQAALRAFDATADGGEARLARFAHLLDGLLTGGAVPVDALPDVAPAPGAAPDTPSPGTSPDAAFDAQVLEALLAFSRGPGGDGSHVAGGKGLPLGGNGLPGARAGDAVAILQQAWMEADASAGRRTDSEARANHPAAAVGHDTGDRRATTPVLLQELLGGQWTQSAGSRDGQPHAGVLTPSGAPGQPPGNTGLAQSPGTAAWGQGLAERVAWMGREGVGRAELALNPPRLGPLEIRLRVDGDQVTVNFSSQSIQVRDALEQALPRLREFLAEGGLELADAHIGADAEDHGRRPDTDSNAASDATPAAEDSPDATTLRHGQSLVDLYA